jgi:hypothetical protein
MFIRKISDQFAQRERELFYQRWRDDNLLRLDLFGMLVDIDYLEFVTAMQRLFAKGSDIPYRTKRFRSAASHEQRQNVAPYDGPPGKSFFKFFHFIRNYSVLAFHNIYSSGAWAQIKTNQYTFGIRQVPNDFPHRLGEFPYKSWKSKNLVSLG